MMIKLTGGKVYDPTNKVDGQVRDIYVADGRIIPPAPEARVDKEYDLKGRIVMAGAIDPHTHIGGGKSVEEPVGDLALGEQRQVLARAVGREDRDPVRVGPEAGARFGHVVGHEQVDALAAELVGCPLERARLGREAHDDRPRGRARAARAADLGEDVLGRLELEGQRLAARAWSSRPGPAGSRRRPRPSRGRPACRRSRRR